MFAALLVVLIAPRPGAAATEEAIDAAIRRGANFLIESRPGRFPAEGYSSLRLYALLKAKTPKDHPIIAELTDAVLRQFRDGRFEPDGIENEHTYTAGVNAMIFLELGPEKYEQQLDIIRRYLLSRQLENGAFNYRGNGADGDTSVTQYAMLGLWAVGRAGFEIPSGAFQRAARWHAVTRQADGGHAYRPRPRGNNSTLNMTVAAIGSIGICEQFFAEGKEETKSAEATRSAQLRLAASQPAEVTPDAPPVRYGLLLPVIPEEEKEPEPEPEQVELTDVPEELDRFQNESDELTKAAARRLMKPALGHLNRTFEVRRRTAFAAYYYYALERAATLAELETIDGIDWYDACADYLIETQNSRGEWHFDSRSDAETAFCVLFLARSTQQLVGKKKTKKVDRYGGGLLIGGRGLPKDLTKYGETQEDTPRRIETPLEKLLSDLANADETALPELQEKLVEEVQLGDHAALVGQSDLLIELTRKPKADLRRVAAWAIGRTGELKLARHVLPLFDDPDPAVLTEARNAMSWIARRPDAFGLPEYPPSDAAELAAWRTRAWVIWGNWYLENAPYRERLDEFELNLRTRLGYIRENKTDPNRFSPYASN